MSTPIGGPTTGFWITPGEVQKAGESARKVAKDIPDEIKTLYTPTDAAVAGLAGFETAKAIDDCLEAWAKALRSLAGMVEGAADAVGSSSTSFVREDHARGKSFQGFGPYAPYAPGVTAPTPHGPYAPGVTPTPGLFGPTVTVPPASNGGH
ncbi:hypothetical protein A8W25_27040 [Streptomyces sp. ERV7]|uniref:type VII secretion target n=1 Tax=Streptomyces sp. ERV7 TaxID=1322334 RepID=UPI0007F48DB8|nr:type VII secretion target [Streptomyces sp. ERV7]OAR23166.1 hypothetical protein A8W25_27040 [Streptomyces sp. ERV7]